MLQFTFADLDCLEIARQMCIVEQGLFKAILPRECLNQAWNHKTHKETAAPNILAIIRRFNRVSAWVANEVVIKELLPERSKTLERMILIAWVSVFSASIGMRAIHSLISIAEICTTSMQLSQFWPVSLLLRFTEWKRPGLRSTQKS